MKVHYMNFDKKNGKIKDYDFLNYIVKYYKEDDPRERNRLSIIQ
jgi:hypothetical protein